MRRSARVVLLVGVLVACDGGGEEAATTTAGQETTTTVENTTTTVAPDPFAVPDDPADIDEAYVEAVLAELERINGDALRLAVSEGLSPRIRELLESAFSTELAGNQAENLAEAADSGFATMLSPPGDAAAVVTAVQAATPSCVSVDAIYDFTAVTTDGVADLAVRVELRPKPEDAGGENRTPWIYDIRAPLENNPGLPEPCAGQ